MAFITQIKFAKLAGASATQVKNAIKSGGLIIDSKSKGLDPAHPKNKAWLEEWSRKTSKPGPKGKKSPLDTLTESIKEIKRSNDLAEKIIDYGNLEDQKLEQEIKLKIEQRLAIKQKRLASMGVFILREIVEKRLAKLGQALKTHVLTSPRKVSPKIHSMVLAGATVGEIEKEYAKDLEKALRNAKL